MARPIECTAVQLQEPVLFRCGDALHLRACRHEPRPQGSGITCPTLALAGEGDFAGTGQLQTFADALTVPVTTHEFTVAEGAGGHCEWLGQDLLDQYVYGWLARVLTRTAVAV